MAQRDLTTFRTVTQQVVENKDQLLNAGAEIAEGILRRGEEAKLAEGFSVAQLDLAALDNQYKVDFQGDPTNKQGIAKYKADRQGIYDGLQKNISPLYRSQWQEGTRKLTERNDGMMQAWGLQQTQVNTVASINNSMKNGLLHAAQDGAAIGLATTPEEKSRLIGQAILNATTSSENISAIANTQLGETTGAAATKDYNEDRMKTLISSVLETNAVDAARMLDNETVKNSFSDPEQWSKMRRAVEIRADIAEQVKLQARTAATLGGENQLAAGIGRTGYSELQQNFEKFNMSDPVRKFYEEVNGYGKQKKALTAEQKSTLKRRFNIFLSDFIGKTDVSNNDMRGIQDSVYTGMRKQGLSKNEGFGLLNQLMSPLIDEQQERAAAFQTGAWNPFQENLGLDSLDKEIDRLSNISPDVTLTPEQEFNDNKNANIMYDFYLGSLADQAKARKTTVAGLTGLGFSEEKKVYNKALNAAKEGLIRITFPELSNVQDLASTSVDTVPDTVPENLRFDTEDAITAAASDGSIPDGTQVMVGGQLFTWSN